MDPNAERFMVDPNPFLDNLDSYYFQISAWIENIEQGSYNHFSNASEMLQLFAKMQQTILRYFVEFLND